MAQTSKQLDEKLRQEGYTPTTTDPNKYVGLNDQGRPVPVWTDDDWVYENGSWTKK